MFPNYPYFKSDLEELKQKIGALREEFRANVTKDLNDRPYGPAYEALTKAFADIETSFAVLESENATEDEKNAAWETLTGRVSDAVWKLPRPYEENDADADRMNTYWESGSFRALYSVAKRLDDLAGEADMIEIRGGYYGIDSGFSRFEDESREYVKAVYTVPETLEYQSYWDMQEKAREYRTKEQEARRALAEMEEEERVEKLEREYNETRKAVMVQIYKIEADNADIARAAREVEAALREERETIRALELREKEIRAEEAKKLADKAKLEEELKETEARLEIAAQQITQLNKQLEDLEWESDDTLRYLAEKVEAADRKYKTKQEKALAEKVGAFAGLLLKNEDVAALKTDFENEMRKKGYADLDEETFRKRLANGKVAAGLPKNILDQYKEINFRTLLDDYEMYLTFDGYRQKLRGLSEPLYGTEPTGIDDTVDTPDAFLRVWNEKGYMKTQEKIAEMLETKGPEEAERLTHVYNIYKKIGFDRMTAEQLGRDLEPLLKQKAALERQREQAAAKLEELERAIENATYERQLAPHEKRVKALEGQLERLDEQDTRYRAEITKKRGVIIDALGHLETAQKAEKNCREDAEKYRKLYEKAVADTNTVEEVYAKRLAAGKTYDAVKGKANLRRNDAVHRLKQHVELTVNNFLDTRNCCKRARHTNTAEFEAVGTALRGLTEEINRIAATISLADVKYRLERIREAAQNYLDIKNRETIVRASNQRKYRMDWAKRLVTFADNAAKEIGETDKALKVIDDRTAAAKTVHDHLPEDRGEVFYQINEAIEKRTREQQAAGAEKQKAAEPKPEAKPQPPMLP